MGVHHLCILQKLALFQTLNPNSEDFFVCNSILNQLLKCSFNDCLHAINLQKVYVFTQSDFYDNIHNSRFAVVYQLKTFLKLAHIFDLYFIRLSLQIVGKHFMMCYSRIVIWGSVTHLRFVPRLLTTVHQVHHVSVCTELKQKIRDNLDFISIIIIGTKPWIYSYDPKTREQLSQ